MRDSASMSAPRTPSPAEPYAPITGPAVASLWRPWAAGSAPPGMSGTRASGIVVLALGFAASASAVVPGFAQLLHGNKAYLVLTSLLGTVALVGGVHMLVAASETGLGIAIVAMIVLWLIATIHHSLPAQTASSPDDPGSRAPRHRAPDSLARRAESPSAHPTGVFDVPRRCSTIRGR